MRVGRAQLLLIIGTLIISLAAMLYFAFRISSRSRESYDRAYAAIKVGDSRAAVVATMGQPRAVTDCSYTPFSDKKLEAEYRIKCFQKYEYVEFMTSYTISFDHNGVVINKSMAVSP